MITEKIPDMGARKCKLQCKLKQSSGFQCYVGCKHKFLYTSQENVINDKSVKYIVSLQLGVLKETYDSALLIVENHHIAKVLEQFEKFNVQVSFHFDFPMKE